jgi:hypothetical protein
MKPVDRARIEELLQDEKISFRAVAREVGASDWSVRRIARELDDDPRPMKQPRAERGGTCYDTSDSSGPTGWIALASVVGFVALTIWASTRWMPPPEM